MISTTLLGVAFCSCDFALRCPIPGGVAVETGARKRGRHGRFPSGVARRDNCDCRARRERLRIQRPPHPPVDVARSTGVVGNLPCKCDCIRCWVWTSAGYPWASNISLAMSATKPFNRQFVRLFVYRVAVSRIAQQKVLLLGSVLALATRTGSIGGRRVMTPTLLVMIAI